MDNTKKESLDNTERELRASRWGRVRREGFWESLGFREIRSFYEITWIFGDFLSYELFVHNLYSKKKNNNNNN